MTLKEFIKIIASRKKVFVIVFVLFLFVSALATSLEPFKYGTNLKLLTVHNFRENVDPYTASKSNEFLSGLLSKIIYSSSFFNKVKEVGNMDKSYFDGTTKKQMKKWEKTIKAKSLGDSGIISLDIFHPEKEQAEEIARSVAYVLASSHSLYHGYGKNVDIKIIDEPITSTFPVKPNLIIVFSMTVVASIIFSLFYIYLSPAKVRSKKNFSNNDNDDNDNYEDNNNWSRIGELINSRDFEDKHVKEEEPIRYVNKTEDFTEGNMDNVLKR